MLHSPADEKELMPWHSLGSPDDASLADIEELIPCLHLTRPCRSALSACAQRMASTVAATPSATAGGAGGAGDWAAAESAGALQGASLWSRVHHVYDTAQASGAATKTETEVRSGAAT